jgi:hypothetical protein
LGQVDRWLKRVFPWEVTPALMGIPKQSHGARDANGAELAGGQTPGERISIGLQQIPRLARAWCLLSTIEYVQMPMLSIPMQQKSAASKPRALRFHHGQHGLCCHEGIHRTASFHQHRVGRNRGEWMGCDHHG